MENEGGATIYEEERRQRLLVNQQRLEELGILKLSKSLSDVKKIQNRSQNRHVRRELVLVEPRRSSRARNPVPSYRDQVDVGLPPLRKRARFSSSWASYLARPIEEVKSATYEERNRAYKLAEKVENNLESEHPSFVKSMVRSHVYSCFWLGLPTRFCEEHLAKTTVDMVLEDEEGTEYDAVFISKRTGLSGGWRAFALDHKLDDGDALVFQLVEPTRFKVYIVRAFGNADDDQEDYNDDPVSEAGSDAEEETPEEEVVKLEKTSEKEESKKSAKKPGKMIGKAESKKSTRKPGKKSEKDESNNTTKIKNEKSTEVSAVRRSSRNK